MEHEDVAVWIGEVRHVTDAAVEDLAVERDALPLQIPARLRDIGDTQSERAPYAAP